MYSVEKIIKIHHWNNSLFSIICTRKKEFKFKNGEFVMLGLNDNNNNFISRAYSIVSTNYENFLEFLSVKVKDGKFTSILKNININNNIFISKKTTGTLIIENISKNCNKLIIFSSGTGLAPFISLIKCFDLHKEYENVFLFHSVNIIKDLSYRYYINNIFFKFFEKKINFIYYPIVTKEKFINNKRITFLLEDEKFLKNFIINIKNFAINFRIMICGNINMIKDIKSIIEKKYMFFETKKNILGNYLTEKAFLD
ncbi:MAG: FAD-binding oxidoreductase [Candidatus Nasuia deltocephalinicola]